jgi:hypothetical protein
VSVTGTYSALQLSLSYTFASVFASVASTTPPPVYTLALPDCTAGVGPDGARTIYARAIDLAGNVSGAIKTDIRVDMTPPSGGAIYIDDDAPHTSSLDWSVLGLGSDAGGIATLRLYNASSVCTSASATVHPWAGSKATYDFTHPATIDGTKTLYACLIDGAGNSTSATTITDTIILDRAGPTGVTVNATGTGGGPYTCSARGVLRTGCDRPS